MVCNLTLTISGSMRLHNVGRKLIKYQMVDLHVCQLADMHCNKGKRFMAKL